MQRPSDAAAVPFDINSSAGACQRFASQLQLQLSTVTVLLAAVWAIIAHVAQALVASIVSGVSSQTATAKSSLVLLRNAGCIKRRNAAKLVAAALPAPTGSEEVPSSSWSQHTVSNSSRARLLHQRAQKQHQPPQFATAAVSTTQWQTSSSSCTAGIIPRVPSQLQEHMGRLTVALDLDETLLCTYRIEACPGGSDRLQLVPANRPGALLRNSTRSSSMAWGKLSLSALLKSGTGVSSSNTSSSASCGTYSVSMQCEGLPELGAAAGATAWMHYTPPAPYSSNAAGTSRTRSSIQGQQQAASLKQQQQQSSRKQPLLPGPHTLAVYERPGCREFLSQLSSFAELVLFTAASREYAAPLADMLDPHGHIFRGRLYADACVSRAGRRGVKDLGCLGRDEARVVLVDNCLFSFLAQPCNGLPCMPFHGEAGDTQLLGVILPLLRSLSQVGGDIRPLLDSMFRVRQWLGSKGYPTPPPPQTVVAAAAAAAGRA